MYTFLFIFLEIASWRLGPLTPVCSLRKEALLLLLLLFLSSIVNVETSKAVMMSDLPQIYCLKTTQNYLSALEDGSLQWVS